MLYFQRFPSAKCSCHLTVELEPVLVLDYFFFPFGLGHKGIERAVVPDAPVFRWSAWQASAVPHCVLSFMASSRWLHQAVSPLASRESHFRSIMAWRVLGTAHASSFPYSDILPCLRAQGFYMGTLNTGAGESRTCVCDIFEKFFLWLTLFSIYFWLSYNELDIIMTFLNKILVVLPLLSPTPPRFRWPLLASSYLSPAAFPFLCPMCPFAFPIFSHHLTLLTLGFWS